MLDVRRITHIASAAIVKINWRWIAQLLLLAMVHTEMVVLVERRLTAASAAQVIDVLAVKRLALVSLLTLLRLAA